MMQCGPARVLLLLLLLQFFCLGPGSRDPQPHQLLSGSLNPPVPKHGHTPQRTRINTLHHWMHHLLYERQKKLFGVWYGIAPACKLGLVELGRNAREPAWV
ncbi:uncharacterized protein RAG0_04698 [Rhynchosporium agropyri]|uniref:Uncharacterized protein n=1 Tax=Rhynchosporium agropyri TaxID=914238 RepID=A0A1E1K9Z5_9HELO|nr:uncharacterized protein RAG0_04698 [Rhynchosporium agropyri]